MPKAIIIGATSGIGLGLAQGLYKEGYQLGLTGRREERLLELKKKLDAKIQVMDITRPEQSKKQLVNLITSLDGLDLLIINAGISHRNGNWAQEQSMINTNVSGFTAMAKTGFDFFINQKHGHLVGISSISGIRGRANNIAYSATKAYISNYLQGCRQKAYKMNTTVNVTDIIPGYVDTRLIKGHSGLFWVASIDTAVKQMIRAIKKKKKRVFITNRWCIIAWFLTLIPDWFHQKL